MPQLKPTEKIISIALILGFALVPFTFLESIGIYAKLTVNTCTLFAIILTFSMLSKKHNPITALLTLLIIPVWTQNQLLYWEDIFPNQETVNIAAGILLTITVLPAYAIGLIKPKKTPKPQYN